MNLTSTECEERNAHMQNTRVNMIGVLRMRNGVSLYAYYVGMTVEPGGEISRFHFKSLSGERYQRRSVDKYWDFSVVKEGI